MDVKQIQELVRIITRTSISEIEIEEKDIKIVIRQKTEVSSPQPMAAPAQAAPAVQQYVAPAAAPTAAPPAQPAAPPKAADNLITIKSSTLR